MEQISVNMQPNGVGTVRFGSDTLINVAFFDKAVLNRAKSRDLGRPYHDLVPYVRIQHPGERDYSEAPISDKPNTPSQFPTQYQAYLQKRKHVPDGTPVEMLFPQSPEIAANLHGIGIHVIEQLANLSAEGTMRMGMGGQDWVNRAKKYIESAKHGVEYHQMQRELEKRDNQIEVLQNQISMLKMQIDRLGSEKAGTAQKTLLSVESQAPIAAQAMQGRQILPDDPPLQLSMNEETDWSEFMEKTSSEIVESLPPVEQKRKGGWPKGKPRKPKGE